LPEFRRELSEAILAAAKRDGFLAGNPPEIIWNGFQADDYVLEPGSDFENTMRAAHRAVTKEEPQETILPAVTDCRFYGRYYGIPSLAYGPASTDGHGFDEFVELESLKKATIVIAGLIGEWCGLRPIG
jgi:acetylornithine deacetylase